MERFGPKNLPPNPFLPPQPRTVMSIESGENGGGGSNKKETKIEKAPAGWKTTAAIVQEEDSSFGTVQRLAAPYRDSHPDWFKLYQSSSSKSNKKYEHYHPELVAVLKKKLYERTPPPEGWKTANTLGQTMGGVATVNQAANLYRDAHPKWFSEHWSHSSFIEHFHPDLISQLKKDLASEITAREAEILKNKERKLDLVPEGWLTNSALSKQLEASFSTIKKIADTYRDAHPEWFKEYKTNDGRIREHYSFQLQKEITLAIEGVYENAPEGWRTNKDVQRALNTEWSAIIKIVNPFRKTHPQWFKKYRGISGYSLEHFHPDLVAHIKSIFKTRPETLPNGWMTNYDLGQTLNVSFNTVKSRADIYRTSNPEWFHLYTTAKGKSAEHFHPDLVKIITTELRQREPAPEDWITVSALADKLKTSYEFISKLKQQYRTTNPQWFKKYLDNVGKLVEFVHPGFVLAAQNTSESRTAYAPPGWRTTNEAAVSAGWDRSTVLRIVTDFRKSHPEWFKIYLDKGNRHVEHYHPDLLHIITKELSSRPTPAPKDWLTNGKIAEILKSADQTVKNIADRYRASHPEWFREHLNPAKLSNEHYHPELIAIIRQGMQGAEQPAPPGWVTNASAAKYFGIHEATMKKAVESFRISHPEWFKEFSDSKRHGYEHYSPELIQSIKHDLPDHLKTREHKKKEDALISKLEDLLSATNEKTSVVGQHFLSLLKAFGSSRYLDVLYKFRSEFKGIPAEKVKGLMAEYLGDFLISRGGFDKGDIEAALEHLSDLSLQEGLYETVKDDCFQFFLKQRRADGTKNPALVLERYRIHVEKELGHLDHPLFREIVEKAVRYYVELYSKFEKPPQIIDSLEAKRDFPDLNQLINIREIAEKKRMLIADEMGLGKSASVILSKESLGVQCALTVVPSNVIETWKRYLSDKPDEGGYFKPGQGPRIFVVEKSEQLKDLSWEQYDYILISQEKLQGAYPEHLKRIGYDMLIVDEAHKLKTPTGTRSSNLAELTNEAGEHGYLALLSGTPVPNKIEDIAVTLKLLYPEKFKDIGSKQLVRSIIKGDLVDLRSLLLPKMQRKRLEDGVEMPSLEEHVYPVELSKLEQQVYEVLLEDDELVATEKMRVMRQFLLNPSLVDSTPGIEGAKIIALRERLADAFKESSSVVVFVNDYVEGVLRGPDAISNKLELPSDIRIVTIHGGTPRQEREAIQRDLREGNGRNLLLVSGQTADVGVDFSSASHVVFYNEPWTEYQKRQELGRVYRPGLKHALESETLIAEGTIEQGMHEYIRRKHSAIEKLLSGVPITELEQRLLERSEKEEMPDLSVNPELAKYYFSSWDKMMKIFGYVKELGEEQFEIFLKEHGSEYAEGYQELGNRSYQANANRLVSTLIDRLVRESKQEPSKQRILDMASGPEMLRKHGPKEYRDGIVSLDLNPEHFKTAEGKFVAGSWLKMPFPDKSFDYLNLSLSLHYTNFVPRKGKLERLELLKEMNRVLEIGGKAVLSLIYSYGLKNPEMLREAVKELGFEVAEPWTGDASQGDSFQTHVITLNKMKDLDSTVTAEDLSERLGRDKREGLKFAERKARLRDSRRILTGVQLNGEALPVQLNEADQEAYTEEQQVLRQGEKLRDQYGSIAKIPAEKIIELGFARIRSGEKYILFKKLEKGSGAILVR